MGRKPPLHHFVARPRRRRLKYADVCRRFPSSPGRHARCQRRRDQARLQAPGHALAPGPQPRPPRPRPVPARPGGLRAPHPAPEDTAADDPRRSARPQAAGTSPPRRRPPPGHHRRPHRGRPGTTVTVTIDGREPCDDCDGSGQRSYGRTSMCGSCHGSGRLRRRPARNLRRLRRQGLHHRQPLPVLRGRGWQPADRQLAVTVPPPCCPAKSSASPARAARPDGGDPGDLYLTLRTRPTRSSGCSTTTSTWRCR
jgi:hypothetical protein